MSVNICIYLFNNSTYLKSLINLQFLIGILLKDIELKLIYKHSMFKSILICRTKLNRSFQFTGLMSMSTFYYCALIEQSKYYKEFIFQEILRI